MGLTAKLFCPCVGCSYPGDLKSMSKRDPHWAGLNLISATFKSDYPVLRTSPLATGTFYFHGEYAQKEISQLYLQYLCWQKHCLTSNKFQDFFFIFNFQICRSEDIKFYCTSFCFYFPVPHWEGLLQFLCFLNCLPCHDLGSRGWEFACCVPNDCTESSICIFQGWNALPTE